MLILLKLHLFISSLLDFLFCVMFSSRSDSENHSCNFLKFCESKSTTNMMRICLLSASANRILPRKLVLNFGSSYMPQHIDKLGSIHAIGFSNLVLKMVMLIFSGSSYFCLPLHLSIQNSCKVQYMW